MKLSGGKHTKKKATEHQNPQRQGVTQYRHVQEKKVIVNGKRTAATAETNLAKNSTTKSAKNNIYEISETTTTRGKITE